jgi:hypothetical protein
MRRSIKLSVLTAAVFAAMLGEAQAGFQVFSFSFPNDPRVGNVDGPVTGEIVLPFVGDGTGAASHVVLDSFPAGLVGLDTQPPSAWSIQNTNTFTVTGGMITAAFFDPMQRTPQYLSGFVLGGSLNALYTSNLTSMTPLIYQTADVGGLAAAHWTFVSVTTPEPVSVTVWGTVIVTVGAFHFVRRRRKSKTAQPPRANR